MPGRQNHKLEKLEDLYFDLTEGESFTLFVSPQIRIAYKRSDYLFLLYKDLLSSAVFKIDSVSTIGHLKFVLWALLGNKTILHYHWLEYTGFFAGFNYFFKLFCIWLYKKLGGKVVWSIHNKLPLDCSHEWIHFKTRKWLAQKADRLLIECESVLAEISTYFNVHINKFRVWPHPSYPPQLMPRAAAVEAINHRYNVSIKVQDRLFLMFGHISPYKQIDKVCEIFLKQPIQKKLMIVGPVKNGQMKHYKKIRKLSQQKENIVLIPQFIKEECVPEFMNATDYVLFNYRDVLSSGGVPLARSYDKPIILPKKGCLKDLTGENLRFFTSQEELSVIIGNL
jgi:glycosyltransferase involved in cell wall biosynthesis